MLSALRHSLPHRDLVITGLLGGLIGGLLAGCATRIDVQSIGTADGSQVYELRGHQLAGLQARAQALCPQGHTVLRQWQHARAGDPAGSLQARGWVRVADVLAPGEQDQAQLQVQCAPVVAAQAGDSGS